MTGFTRLLHSAARGAALLAILLAGGIFQARAADPVFERIDAFTRGPSTPEAKLLRVADGSFYGTTSRGGADDKGTIFRVQPSGSYQVVLSFTGGNGAYPKAGLIAGPGGDLYGTTYAGGVEDRGTVFKLKPDGTLLTLYSFDDPGQPVASVTLDAAGNLYGTCISSPCVFKLTPGGVFTRLVNFDNTNGSSPAGGVVLGPDGNLHGTTKGGVVYKVTPGGQFTEINRFPVPGLASPQSGVIFGPGGNLYGTTYTNVYKVTPGGTYSILGTFNGANGDLASAELTVGPDGYLYGTTYAGGPNQYGAVFKVAPEGGGISLVAGLHYPIGGRPVTALELGADGNFYGTGSMGGPMGRGSVFRVLTGGELTPSFAITTFYEVEHRSPKGSLTSAGDGSFYGVTGENNTVPRGTAYRVSAAGQMSRLAVFTQATGLDPRGSMARGDDGNYYGTARVGGTWSNGTVFRLTPQGTLTALHHFRNETPEGAQNGGYHPETGLVRGADGNFYGICPDGGAFFYGCLFRITPAGAYTVLVNFNKPGGHLPLSPLVAGSDGCLYGSTSRGGTWDSGTFFKITLAGTLSTLASQPANGNPGLITEFSQDPDGNFYGTSKSTGSNGYGTAFKLTPGGTLTALYEFGGSRGGWYPAGGLTRGPDGDFYGTTYVGNGAGGVEGTGTLFRLTPAGVLTTLINFNGPDGKLPQSKLVAGPDGNLYGNTLAGGTTASGQAGDGQVFRLRFGPTPVTSAATQVRSSSALLGGMVDPHGALTRVSFQYGTSPDPATFTSVDADPVAANAGPGSVVVRALDDLSPATTYYFRIVATNPGNPVPQTGEILSFKTSAATAFDLWRQAAGAAGGISGDPDHDGLTNLLEYAFGTNPTLRDGHATREEAGAVASRGLPALRLPAALPGEFEVAPRGLYVRRLDRGASGLSYRPQFSADLDMWHDDTTPATILATDDEVEIISLAFPTLPDGRAAKFFRLRVAVP